MFDGMSENVVAMSCAGLFALALGGLGIVLIVLYLRNKKKAKESESWPFTEGEVVANDVRIDEIDDEDFTRVRYIPQVRFEYQVDGQSYTGKRISYGSDPSFNSRQKALDFLNQFPVGNPVRVFYNPEKPQEAVLSQELRKMTAGLIVGIVLVVLMVCFLCPIAIGLVNAIVT